MTIEPSEDGVTRWHLDKTVPVSLIAALLLQFIIGLWFVSKLDSRVYALEILQIAQAKRDDIQDASYAAAVAILRQDVKEVGGKLDRLIETGLRK